MTAPQTTDCIEALTVETKLFDNGPGDDKRLTIAFLVAALSGRRRAYLPPQRTSGPNSNPPPDQLPNRIEITTTTTIAYQPTTTTTAVINKLQDKQAEPGEILSLLEKSIFGVKKTVAGPSPSEVNEANVMERIYFIMPTLALLDIKQIDSRSIGPAIDKTSNEEANSEEKVTARTSSTRQRKRALEVSTITPTPAAISPAFNNRPKFSSDQPVLDEVSSLEPVMTSMKIRGAQYEAARAVIPVLWRNRNKKKALVTSGRRLLEDIESDPLQTSTDGLSIGEIIEGLDGLGGGQIRICDTVKCSLEQIFKSLSLE
ncbi:hypothetical protein M407DRAFT_28611 [Tulasnella calospora MUT 4182]|uniref:Uncharacterized protein n=1 Tax=Tulasnella calospora MUT 4182 TaxID=1051891 RepID=A0A0C3KK09_9AGAM|nr:hypothetical protein M407DRAFT_28611 [Tulasnella calospora MUT 4182]